ncbi:MAG TPA: hypothetical protein VH879_17175 [Gemmatimonadales bacterium]|jgi:hypothetical protein
MDSKTWAAGELESWSSYHAYEGQLFRVILEQALEAHGLRLVVVRGRDLLDRATAVLGQSEPALRSRVTELGRMVGSPWRSEQKAATLAAWLALAEAPSVRQGT